MGSPTDPKGKRNSRLEPIMMSMGWRYVSLDPGRPPMWVKYYPPPQDLPAVPGHARIIATQGSPAWREDLRRAQCEIDNPDPSLPGSLADFRWDPRRVDKN